MAMMGAITGSANGEHDQVSIGEEVREGDHVRYLGARGIVEFVVVEKCGEPSMDWYVEQFPGGGAMLIAEEFGRVFVSSAGMSGHLELISRR